jgi:hypothetical protein
MRAYLAGARRGDEAAGQQRELFEAHARRLADEVAAVELRRDLAAAERTAADIRATTGNPAVSAARLDLLDRGSGDQLARDLAGPLVSEQMNR